MAITRVNLADLQQTMPLVDSEGRPSPAFLRYLNTVIQSLKNGVNSLIDVQNAIDEANAAAAAAATAAAAAQASADAAQATADAIVVPPTGTRTVTSDTTATTSDRTILVDATAGTVAVTLPAASAAYEHLITVQKIDASINAVNILAVFPDLINGGSSLAITAQYDAITATSSGTDWYA